jgi:Fe-S-cluster-containing dehydrogenase component
MKVFIVDADKCNGCYSCQIACKDEHVGNAWPPYALPQPNTGQFWMRVDEQEHGSLPKIRVEYTPVPCMHCDDAPCIKAAPDAVYKRKDGIVIIDPEKARGNAALVAACPYGAIYYNVELQTPQKCTGCAHLLDEGKLPHCADLCATGGLRFGDEEDFIAEIATAEVKQGELGTKPRVYYLNLPHLFIAGEVWDPDANEIIEAAVVTLTLPDGSKRIETTDDFGDFWFKRIDAGSYTLDIAAKGFKSVSRDIELTESLNLGDFPLEKNR